MVRHQGQGDKIVVMQITKDCLIQGAKPVSTHSAAWLAAMIECEGTVTFQYNEQIKGGKLHTHIQPRVVFVNSDYLLVDAVKQAMADFSGTIPYDYVVNSARSLGKKPKRDVQINGFKCLPLLKAIQPEMVGVKAEVTKCVIDFIEYRQSLKQPKQKYGDYEFELLRRVRQINTSGWVTKPKFALISTEAVAERRAAVVS